MSRRAGCRHAWYSHFMADERPPYSLHAPGAEPSPRSYEMPGRGPRRRSGSRPPRVDQHHPSVRPEISRNELIDGRVVHASPAKFPHGSRNFDLDYLVGAHLAEGYRGATDLITRFDRDNDFASDTAIVKDGVDPATGTRYLEEIAFEIVSEQGEKVASTKAARMLRRGVRRVFGIFVKKGEVREWVEKEKKAGWVQLAPDDRIEDPCLDVPLEVAAILDVARRDDAVGHALIAKQNPAIVEHAEKAKAAGKAEFILSVLEKRGLETSAGLRRQILACTDSATLEQWLTKALVITEAREMVEP